jgi:NADPH:quinone reductase-like Zn-dependent oxidoreductase
MKAIVWTAYGPPEVLQLREVEKPTPKDDEVLVRVHATTVTAGDCELRSFKTSSLSLFAIPMRIYMGISRPTRVTILGQELAGEVEAIGKDVTMFKVGDKVLAATDLRLSAYAEYACVPEKGMVALMPANMSYEEAATIPAGALEAWQYLRGNIKPGQKVLIIGAGGSIGSFAVQIAKYYEAKVTGLDRAEKFEMLRSIGADHVIDYTREDFTKSGLTYDLIFDAPGKSSESQCLKLLAQNGRYLTANPGASVQIRTVLNVFTRTKDAMAQYADRRNEDLKTLRELLETGKVKPFIDRTYPLEQTAEAHRYADTGLKKGNIVITVA